MIKLAESNIHQDDAMPYLDNILPEHFRAVANVKTADLSDEVLSELFGVKMRTVSYADYKVMENAAEQESTKRRDENGRRPGPMSFFCAMLKEKLPDLAPYLNESGVGSQRGTNSLLFYGSKARPVILKTGDNSDRSDYVGVFVRPEKMATAIEYMSATCYGYSQAIMRGAQQGKPELWHELSTLLAASACLGVESNMSGPGLPVFFQEPMWKTDAMALQLFMQRAVDAADFTDRKLIANQFYAVKALVTIGNTYSGAYESQLLKRLGRDDFDQEEARAIESARRAVVDCISSPGSPIKSGPGRVHWGQGMGETFIIMNEVHVKPMYLALKAGLNEGLMADPLQREIAEDFIIGAELLFPRHLQSVTPVSVLKSAVTAFLPKPDKSLLPDQDSQTLLTRVRQAFLPKPK